MGKQMQNANVWWVSTSCNFHGSITNNYPAPEGLNVTVGLSN